VFAPYCLYSDGKHVGHAFYCTFKLKDGRPIRWITQLVVEREVRNHGIASRLLERAVEGKRFLYVAGLVTSNAAAVRALEGATFHSVSLNVNNELGPLIMDTIPVNYVQSGKSSGCETGWSSVDTGFFVDHKEPEDILHTIIQRGENKKKKYWHLNTNLPEGHEFLAISVFSA
jgi:hypothetical protein